MATFFWVENKRDECSFCFRGGRLLKSLSTGKCVCAECVEFITSEFETDQTPMHQEIKED